MGLTTTSSGATKGVLTADELARMLMEGATRKAPAALKRRREEEEVLADPAEQAALPVEDAAAAEENPAAEAVVEGESAQDTESGGTSSSDDVIELAQAPSGAAAVVKPAAVATADEGAAAGLPLLFLGGGALLGFAAIENDGGGAAPPAPTGNVEPATIGDFDDFNDEAGDADPVEMDVPKDGNVFLITNGFDRSLLTPPKTLDELAPDLVYDLTIDFDFENLEEIGHEGLQLNLVESGADELSVRGLGELLDADAILVAVALASADDEAQPDGDMPALFAASDGPFEDLPASDVIWLANLGAVGEGLDDASAIVGAGAIARHGGDAEVGVSDLYVELSGSAVNATSGLLALAAGAGSQAAVLADQMTVSADGAGAMAWVPFVTALGKHGSSDESTNATAAVSNIAVTATGVDWAKAEVGHDDLFDDYLLDRFVDGISAASIGDAHALTSIGGVSVGATAEGWAEASLRIAAYAGEGSGTGTGTVAIGGDVSVSAEAQYASANLKVKAWGDGTVDIDGNVGLSVTNLEEEADGEASPSEWEYNASGTIAAYDDATVSVGSASLDVAGGASGVLTIFAEDDESSVVVGDIDLTATGGYAELYVQHGYRDSYDGHVFIGDVSGTVADDGRINIYIGNLAGNAASDANRSATFTGDGSVYLSLDAQVFGTIDVSALDGEFDLLMWLDDGPDTVPFSTILGYNAEDDSVTINGHPLHSENVVDLDSFSDAGTLFTQLGVALDEYDYAFAVYSGDDITGDGIAESELGVLAYGGGYGDGIDSVLYLPDVTFATLVVSSDDIRMT